MSLMGLGATNIIMNGVQLPEVMENIEKYGVTNLFLPPTAIYVMLAHPEVRNYDYSSLDYFLYAAAPMSVDKLKEAIDVFGPVMAQSYGQAEAPMICTYMSPEQHIEALTTNKAHRLASCGQPCLLTPVEIMDDEENILPVGERGEIIVRGTLVMAGYYKNKDATDEVSASNGWHRTGDDRLLQAAEDAAATLGASPLRVFLTVTLPMAMPGVLAGAVLGFAKAMGEFGATITFVSSVQGETQTLSLAVYSFLQVPGGESAAVKLVIIAVAVAMGALLRSEWLARRMARKVSGA